MASIAALAGMRADNEKRLAVGVEALRKRLGLELTEPVYERDPAYAGTQRLGYMAALVEQVNAALDEQDGGKSETEDALRLAHARIKELEAELLPPATPDNNEGAPDSQPAPVKDKK